MYVSLNQKHPMLSKPEVRQAFKYLVDYEGMQNSFLKGQYTIHQNFLPRTYLGASDENPFTLDIEKAKELLAAAGVGPFDDRGRRARGAGADRDRASPAEHAGAGRHHDEHHRGHRRRRSWPATGRGNWISILAPGARIIPIRNTNAGTFAYNPDNSDEANATGLLAWRNAWDTGGLTAKVEAAVVENDRDVRAQMYLDIQSEFREISPFVIMFQQIEQSALRDNVDELLDRSGDHLGVLLARHQVNGTGRTQQREGATRRPFHAG